MTCLDTMVVTTARPVLGCTARRVTWSETINADNLSFARLLLTGPGADAAGTELTAFEAVSEAGTLAMGTGSLIAARCRGRGGRPGAARYP